MIETIGAGYDQFQAIQLAMSPEPTGIPTITGDNHDP
jgi:hypothetical protein